MNEVYLTVSALNDYLFYKFDNDINLRSVYLKAEISDLRYAKGYLFFSLKDSLSQIAAVMYTQALLRLKFKPQDGMTVLVNGKVSLYKRRGTYSLTVYQMDEAGVGENYLNFLRLKEKLLQEGLFAVEKKKPIPIFPETIGVVTSKTGDALRDVRSTVRKRFPLTKIIVYDAVVQGLSAPSSLIAAIKKANQEMKVDSLIIARGGGSDADLSCFNDEGLARAIFASKIPTISGVGHETDFTICDFVADRRAPTPTGAADAATPDQEELKIRINNLEKRIKNSYASAVNALDQRFHFLLNKYGKRQFLAYLVNLFLSVSRLASSLSASSPKGRIDASAGVLDNLTMRLKTAINARMLAFAHFITSYRDKLELLSPLNVMQKGYAIVFKETAVITSINQVAVGDRLKITLSDGDITSQVIEKRKE